MHCSTPNFSHICMHMSSVSIIFFYLLNSHQLTCSLYPSRKLQIYIKKIHCSSFTHLHNWILENSHTISTNNFSFSSLIESHLTSSLEWYLLSSVYKTQQISLFRFAFLLHFPYNEYSSNSSYAWLNSINFNSPWYKLF